MMDPGKGLPEELRQSYDQNEERMNIIFIKLACRFSKNLGDYLKTFVHVIESGQGITRKNVLQFIKLMTTLEYFSFESEFALKIFETLVRFAKPVDDQEQFEIVTFMLTNQMIQERYLNQLVECLGNNTENSINFSLCLLERLMENTINIMEGKKKGPSITERSISNLLINAFEMAKTRALNFVNIIDHQNFLKICTHSLQIMRKYASAHKNHLLTYSQIWKSQIKIFSYLDIQVIDCLFGILIELCNFKEAHLIQEIEEPQNFQSIVQCSAYCILSCENVNKFWLAYLSKRETTTLDLKNFDEMAIVDLFTQNLEMGSKTIHEIVQKMKIADNFILVTNLMSKANRLKKSYLAEQEVLSKPQDYIKLESIIEISFKALYTPIYKIEEGSVFFSILSEIKTLYKITQNQSIINISENIGLLNLLPPLKIILKKAKNILSLEQNIETLIYFLLNFLKDQKTSQVFQDFILLICEQYSNELNAIPQNQKQMIKKCHSRVNRVIYRCLKIIGGQARNGKKMGGYMRCVQGLIAINRVPPFKESFVYIEGLIGIVQIRSHRFDREIFQLLSRLIKDSQNGGLGRVQCFEKLYTLTIEEKRVFYLELLFDFAQAHSFQTEIVSKMTSRSGQISKTCLFSPISEESQLRNLSYMITTQNISKSTHNALLVQQNLAQIINGSLFRMKLYEQIVTIITKQRIAFNRNGNTRGLGENFVGFVGLMLRMLEIVNDCIEEDNKSKLQKTELYRKIADQILRYVYLITRMPMDEPALKNQVKPIIEKIKKSISLNKLKNFHKMQKVIKTLVTSYIYLQTQFELTPPRKTQTEFQAQLCNILKLMNAEHRPHSKPSQEDLLLSIGMIKKIHERQEKDRHTLSSSLSLSK